MGEHKRTWTDQVNLDEHTNDQKWQIDREAAKFEFMKRVEREEPLFKFFWMLTAVAACLGIAMFGLEHAVKNGPDFASVCAVLIFFPLSWRLMVSFGRVAVAAIAVKIGDWKRRFAMPFYDPHRPIVTTLNKIVTWIVVLAVQVVIAPTSDATQGGHAMPTVRSAIVGAMMVAALLSGLWGDGLWAPAGYAAVLTLLGLFYLDWRINFARSGVLAAAAQAPLAAAGCSALACGLISLPYLLGLGIRWLAGIG
jgi:hypothetical protein